MENSDVLRMFRYALNIPDNTMLSIFKIAECRIDKPQLLNILKKKGDEGCVACSTTLLKHFFDGLIIYNRGRNDNKAAKTDNVLSEIKSSKPRQSLNNNTILKKIRVALDLKQEEMMEIFSLGKINITKGEFTSLFRKEGHKNYKECGDQYLKGFLQGLALRHRS